MRGPDEIAAEIGGLSPADLRVRALRQSGYIDSLEQRLAAVAKALGVNLEAARALRARPGREEARAILIGLATYGYPAADEENVMVDKALVKLGYGPEGEG